MKELLKAVGYLILGLMKVCIFIGIFIIGGLIAIGKGAGKKDRTPIA